MRSIIKNFKKSIRFVVTIFSSREFAFVYCLLGVFAQIAHTYFLTNNISSFTGGFKIFQSVLLSAFISSSLLYFIAIVDNSDTKENKRNKLAVNIFMIIEILINFYYYSRHLLIDAKEIQIFDFIFAMLISCLIPVTIKLYGSHIRAKEWMAEMEDKTENKISNNIPEIPEDILSQISQLIDTKFEEVKADLQKDDLLADEKLQNLFEDKTKELRTEIMNSLDKDISDIFNKNQQLFLTQFENKCKVLVNKQLENQKALIPENVIVP